MLRRAAIWTWEFVVGDDWRTALGVVTALCATALAAAAGLAAWWISPLAILLVLWRSVRRVGAGGRRQHG